MTNPNTIRHRPDGSIDTAFYVERARYLRSCQAHAVLQRPSKDTRKSATWVQRILG